MNLDKAHLSILGFSKGCVVLNQVSLFDQFFNLISLILIDFLFQLILVYLRVSLPENIDA